VYAALRSGGKSYLADWLDPELLKIPGRQFVDGASNIRMAGRLIFWENWESIRIALSSAYNQITADESKSRTRDFLAQHYRRTGQPFGDKTSLVSGLPSVYIVGTLCGGTCSGMFIDVGYCVKEITGLWSDKLPNPNIAKVIGLLTMFDAATLSSTSQQAIQGLAANCFAALKEYDFWCHPETRYQVTFPTRTYAERRYDIDTNERPVDWLYALSCSATDSSNLVTSNMRNNGQPDLESLQHMAAVVLFTETIGGLLAEKEKIRTDYRGRDRALRRNVAQHSPCLATCGVASIWHPRFRIAEGAASAYAARICEDWIGNVEPNERERIEKQASADWLRIVTQHLDRLTSSSTGNLISDLQQELDRDRERVLALPAGQFVHHLRDVLRNLNMGGKYDRHLGDRDRCDQFVRDLSLAIAGELHALVNHHGNLAAGLLYLKQIDQAVRSTAEKMPTEYPSPDLGWLTAREPDLFARLVFRTAAATGRLRQESLLECRRYAARQIKHIRNFRIRPLLGELRKLLGMEVDAFEAQPSGEVSTLCRKIDLMNETLRACADGLKRDREQLSAAVPHTQGVLVVSESPSTSIRGDIERLVGQFEQSVTRERRQEILRLVTAGQNLSEFLSPAGTGGTREKIVKRLSEVLPRLFLEQSRTLDLVDHVMSTRSPAELADLARHGLPHLELTPGTSNLASTAIGRPVSLIMGPNAEAVRRIRQALAGTACEGLFELTVSSEELSHMVIFYREEPLMYMDENLATAELYEGCYRAAERTSPYGLHNHKAGKIVFDPRIFERRKRTKEELMPIALALMSARDADGNWVSSEVFKVERGKLVRRDARRNGLKFRLSADDDGVELCAQEAEIYEYFFALISTSLSRLSREEVVQRINSYLDWHERRMELLGKDAARSREDEQKALLSIPMLRDLYEESSTG
jgi:hypothetical protein